jgi:CRP/FNR family cyclic AMP-dependent transcriptional regulator
VPLFSENTKADALGRAPLFEGLSKSELAQLAKVTEDLEVGAGKVLCEEGKPGKEFFVIVEGEVEVTRGGKEIATDGSVEFFGEIALIEDVPRTATVTAKTPLRFFVLTRQSFLKLLDDNPSVERQVLRALVKRVVATSGDPTA